MDVPDEDWLCRFVEQDRWNSQAKEPFPTAFSASDRKLSVFHVQRVVESGSALEHLCIERLDGAGQAQLRAADFVEAVAEVDVPANQTTPVFNPSVVWRPEEIQRAWLQWAEAHAHVESEQGNSNFPFTYRVALVKRSRFLRPPRDEASP